MPDTVTLSGPLLQGTARMRAEEMRNTFEDEQSKNILLERTMVELVEVELIQSSSRLDEISLAKTDVGKRPFDANAYSVSVRSYSGKPVARVICPFHGGNLLLLLRGFTLLTYHPIQYQACARDMARLIVENGILSGSSSQRSNGGPSVRAH